MNGGSLVGCSPWGRYESDTTEQLHFQFSLSCTGEGNGNPLQCSCLENPRDGGAWWAVIYGVAQSWTRLKRLSSSRIYENLLTAGSVLNSLGNETWKVIRYEHHPPKKTCPIRRSHIQKSKEIWYHYICFSLLFIGSHWSFLPFNNNISS